MTTIGDYVLGFYDGPHATPAEAEDGPIFLGIRNVTPDGRLDFSETRHVSAQEFPRWTKRVKPQRGDVVFSYEATLHRYALIPEGFDGCLGRRMALIRPDPEKLDSRFLHFYLLSQDWRNQVEANVVTGATVDRVPLTKVPTFNVNFPKLSYQLRIADILSAYDDLIENNRRRIALLEDAARQLYKEWFVRLRFPGHEHVKVIDGVPEGWEKLKLGEVLTLQRGFDLPIGSRLEGAVPVYGSTGVVGFHNTPKVEAPMIITGRSGSLGRVCFVSIPSWPLNTSLWVREFKRVTPWYAYFLLSELGLEKFNGGASVPTLDRNVAHAAGVSLPTESLRAVFDELARATFGMIENLKAQIGELAKARDLLLPRLMSGSLAV